MNTITRRAALGVLVLLIGSTIAAADATVSIGRSASVRIKAGETVTFVNQDDRDHRIVADDGSFDSRNLKPGGSYAYRFTRKGVYTFSCSMHPREKGRVVVE